ncbi:hypothetical protein [Brevibacillus formosus]
MDASVNLVGTLSVGVLSEAVVNAILSANVLREEKNSNKTSI